MSSAFRTCKTGRKQSPINVNKASVASPSASEEGITLANFQDGSMALPNSFAHKATLTHTGKLISAAGVQGFFTYSDNWYKLLRIDFHTPSEHTVDGDR